VFRTGILATALTLTVCYVAPAEDKAEPKEKSAEKIKKFQGERRDLLKKIVDLRFAEFEAGRATLDVVLKAAQQLLLAEVELATTPKERLAAHSARLELAKKVEKLEKDRFDAGRASTADYLNAQADRVEAEIGWMKAGGKEKKDSDK